MDSKIKNDQNISQLTKILIKDIDENEDNTILLKSKLVLSLTKEEINIIEEITEEVLARFKKGEKSPSITNLSKKIGINRKKIAKHAKSFLIEKLGVETGVDMYNCIWGKKISIVNLRKIKEITDMSIKNYYHGIRLLSIRELIKKFNLAPPTLSKYIKKYLSEKYKPEIAKGFYNNLWGKQQRKSISTNLRKRINRIIKNSIDLYYRGIKHLALEEIGNKLGISGKTVANYTKNYLIKEYNEKKGIQLYDEIWGRRISTNRIEEIHKKVEKALANYKYGLLIPSIAEMSNHMGISEYTFSDYTKIYLKHKFGIEEGMKKYHSMWIKKLTYQDLIRLAYHRGLQETGSPGKLVNSEEEFTNLSKFQSPSEIKLSWWCGKRNHRPWQTTATNIQQGSWCPTHAEGKSERIIRWYFEKIFKVVFPKTQLRNVIPNYTGRMHFDGSATVLINGEFRIIAFEYNGLQHYEYPNYFHRNEKEFLNQLKRDKFKRKICKENHIILIEFPYFIDPSLKNPEIIQRFIVKHYENQTISKLRNFPQYNHLKKRFNTLDEF